MRKLILFILVFILTNVLPGRGHCQTQTVKLTQLEKGQTGGTPVKGLVGITRSSDGKQRYGVYVNIADVCRPTTPLPTGNTTNLSEFVVKCSTDSIWYIDWEGRSLFLGTQAGGAAVTDKDWLEIGNNQVPDNIRDSIYTDNYASVNVRLVWPNAQLLAGDSTTAGNIVVLGNRESRIGFYRLTGPNWSSVGQEGGNLTARLGLNTTNFTVQKAGGVSPTQPATPYRSIFTVAQDSTITLHDYPQTRNDTNSIVNFLYTDGLGIVRSSPVGELPGGGGSAMDTLHNYGALRAYTGSSLVVYVQNFSYTFNGTQYTTLGGLFRRIAAGSENGGTVLVGTGGRIWGRVWDNVNVQPEWWEVGAYDSDGTTNPSRFTLNGIYNNRDRLQAAVNIGYGKTVLLGAVIRSYDIDIAITVDGELNISGNGVTLRRPNSPTPVLTSNFSGTSCTVTSSAGFRVGMSLLALDILNSKGRSPFYGGYGNEENSRSGSDPTKPIITSISGNTLTYSPAPPATIPTGGILQVNDDIVGLISVTNHSFEIKDIIFDGNWNNGGGTYRFSNDFTASHSLFQTVQSLAIVRMTGLIFKRVPAENVIVCRTIVNGCKADSLFGSFVHISRDIERDEGLVEVSGCEISNTGLATVPVNIHGEAAITWSANPNGYKIHHNSFINGKHFVIGYLTKDDESQRDDDNFFFSDNYCKNYVAVTIGQRPFGVPNFPFAGVHFHNNVFENCGDLVLLKENGVFQKGAMWENVNILNNYFVNGRIICEGIANSIISQNKVVFTNEYATKPFLGRHPAAVQDGVINTTYRAAVVAIGTNFNVLNNHIEAYPTYNDTLRVGLFADVNSLGAFKTAAGATTDFTYSQNILIEGNTIAGFARSITMTTGNFGYAINALEAVNVHVRSNKIYNNGTNAVGYNWGINVPKGVWCEGNDIVAVTGFAIIANGAITDSPTTGKHNTIRGAVISRNRVYGQISIGDGGVGDWNVIVEGNYMTQPVLGANSARNYVAGNILTTSVNLPGLTSPQVPVYNFFLQNKSQY